MAKQAKLAQTKPSNSLNAQEAKRMWEAYRPLAGITDVYQLTAYLIANKAKSINQAKQAKN